MEDYECSSEGIKGSRNKMRWFINCLLRERDGRHSQPSTAPCPSPDLVFGCGFLAELLSSPLHPAA